MSVKLMMSFDDSLCQYGEHLTGLRLREPNAAIVLARVTAEGSFRANRGLNRGSDRIAETVYVGLALRFDHHARQRLGSRVADDDAPGIAEFFLRFAYCLFNCRQGFERRLGAHAHVHDF